MAQTKPLASQVKNDSGVSGATTTDALNTVNSTLKGGTTNQVLVSTGGGDPSWSSKLTLTGGDTNSSSLVLSGSNGFGGAGFHGFLTVQNTTPGATNPNKHFRVGLDGEMQIINSAYNAGVLTLSDAGHLWSNNGMSTQGNIEASGAIVGHGGMWAANPPTNDDGTRVATTSWVNAKAGGAVGGGSDKIFYENATNMTTSYTLTAGKNAAMVGPLTMNNGVTITVPSGQRLVVL